MEDWMNKTIIINKEMANWRLIDQEIVFLHNKENTFYELNKTAAYIWLNVNSGKSIEDIIKGLSTKFSVDQKTAEKDAVKFIDQALKNKIFIFA